MKKTLKISIALIVISLLASCNRYASPFPDGHPCAREPRPNIFRH